MVRLPPFQLASDQRSQVLAGARPWASASFINIRSTRWLATSAGVVVGAGACLPGRYQDATGGGRSMVPVWAEASNASTAFIQIQVP